MKSNRHGDIFTLMRFGVVSVLGLIVDLCVAWTLATLFGQPLTFAAAIGFLSGALVNYLLHEFWTFRDGANALLHTRVVRYMIGLGVVIFVRVLFVYVLETVLGEACGTMFILLTATGLSFAVNFMISRYYVFKAAQIDGNGSERP